MRPLLLAVVAAVVFALHGGGTSQAHGTNDVSRMEERREGTARLTRLPTLDSELFGPEGDTTHGRKLPVLTIHMKGQAAPGHDFGTGVVAEEAAEDDVGAKDHLNSLVAETAAAEYQLSNIAFIKTHKTASTTLAYILFRYARRHHVKLAHFDGHNSAIPLEEAVAQTRRKGRGGLCDIMHYHISVFGQYKGTWNDVEQAYRRILRHPDEVNFITVLREPRTHLLSYYYYFLQPETKVSIEEFLMRKNYGDPAHRRLFNPLSAEFGAYKRQDLDQLLDKALPQAKLVILTERFDEGLMVLRRLLGWSMVDMTYVSVLKTADGAKRYDGKSLVKAPRFEDLPGEVQQKIDDLTQLDRLLYTSAVHYYEKRRDEVAQHLEADLAEFEQLQRVVQTYLEHNPASKANVMYKTANIYAQEKYSQFHEF
ncbi:unnamed protein product [Scytosiphon promiscuus]